MEVGSLLVRLGLDTNNFRRAIDNTRQEVNNLGRDINGTLKTAVAGLVTGFGAAGAWKWLVSGNAQMEQYRQTLNIVMKDTEKAAQTLDWAVKFAAKTPFEIPDIVEATVKLQAYGIEAKGVLGDLGDMAAALGKPLMQAVEAVADAQTGELERLKEFGITKQMLIEQAAEMGKNEIVNAQGQITDMQGLNDALIAIIKERYSGAMEAQSTTLNGMISNLKDWLGTAGRVLGEGVFDNVKTKLSELLGYLNQLSESGKLEEWAIKVGASINGLANIFIFLATHMNIIIPLLAGLATRFAALQIISTVTVLVNAFRNSQLLATIATQGFNAALRANPIGVVVTLLSLLVAAGVALWQNWDTVKAKAAELWEKVQETWDSIKLKISNTWDEVKNKTSEIWNNITNSLTTAWDNIVTKGIAAWNNFKSGILGIWDGIKSGIRSCVNSIISTINSMINKINSISFDIPDWVPGVGGNSLGFDMPNIPKLASGGIVTKPTLALIGEAGPEAVVPLNKGMGATIGTINIYGNNADEIWETFERKLALAGVRM